MRNLKIKFSTQNKSKNKFCLPKLTSAFGFFAFAGLIFALTGCQNLKTRSDISQQERKKSNESAAQPGKTVAESQNTISLPPLGAKEVDLPTVNIGTTNSSAPTTTNPASSASAATGATSSPAPSLSRQLPKVGVILGGGGIKSFAHIGVLREFARARIPVESIVGLEWGSLMAALFSAAGQVNEMEWKSMRMKATDLPESSLLSRKVQPESIQVMNDYLQTVFASSLLEKAKISFSCPAYSTSQEKLVWFARGSMKDAVSKCLPYPPYFVENQGYLGTPMAIEEAAQALRQKGATYIIYVNVLHQGELFPSGKKKDYSTEQVLWQEAKRNSNRNAIPGVQLVLQVDTGSGNLMDFEGRRNMIEAGSKSARDVTNQLVNQYGF